MEMEMKKKFREAMNKVEYFTTVKDEWVLDILKCNPEWDQKTNHGKHRIIKGCGLNNDFKLLIYDELQWKELDSISWVKSIKCHLGHSIRYYGKVKIAKIARELVLDQIIEFRIKNNVPREGFHIDHYEKNFQEIFNEWMEQIGKNMDTITEQEIIKHQEEWKSYHKKHAKLQCLSIADHKQITRERLINKKTNINSIMV